MVATYRAPTRIESAPRGDEIIDFSAARAKTFEFASFARQIAHL